ncbi:hypothetical protein, partial [Sphingobacterium wenxiniae]|uniref:hypothetical protein n=1 Tax=Sphingobacterium wenxiniae TaxID=683125 RepID=UPI00147CB093
FGCASAILRLFFDSQSKNSRTVPEQLPKMSRTCPEDVPNSSRRNAEQISNISRRNIEEYQKELTSTIFGTLFDCITA